MKKAIVTLSVILLTAMSVYAGGDNTGRPIYSRFSQNWFIDATGTINAWQGSDRSALVDFNTIYYKNAAGDFGRWGGSFRIGKLVSPTMALRLAADMNQATNMYGDFIFESVHFDVMLSLMDWLGGYREDRVYRMIPYFGFGVAGHADDWFQVKNLNKEYCAVLGLQNNFRLGRYFDLHLDLQATAPKWMIECNHPEYDKRLVHFNFSGGLGLTCYLGGRHFDLVEGCPEVNCPEVNCPEATDCSSYLSQIEALQARIKELENQGPEVINNPCENIESAPFSIFFNRDSYQFRDSRDVKNLEELAKAAKANNYKINLRGTCDDATATSEYNKKLAENRCNKVKDELVKLGVAASNITIDPVGGVHELTPAEHNRRVLITFSK